MIMQKIRQKKHALAGALIGAILLSTASFLIDIIARLFGIL